MSHVFGPFLVPAQASPALEPGETFDKIFFLLRTHTGHDFSQYKRNTIRRRVERRMAVHQINRLEDYIRYLELTPAEVTTLFRDLLTGVTNFFRDTEMFDKIQKQVIPRLFMGKPAGAPGRDDGGFQDADFYNRH